MLWGAAETVGSCELTALCTGTQDHSGRQVVTGTCSPALSQPESPAAGTLSIPQLVWQCHSDGPLGLGWCLPDGTMNSGWALQAEVQEETCTVTKQSLGVPGHTHTKEQSSAMAVTMSKACNESTFDPEDQIEGIFFLKCRFLYRGPAKSLLVTKGWAERPRWGILGHEKVGIMHPGEGSKEMLLLSGLKGGL